MVRRCAVVAGCHAVLNLSHERATSARWGATKAAKALVMRLCVAGLVHRALQDGCLSKISVSCEGT